MKKEILFIFILFILLISLCVGYNSIEISGGYLKDNNVIWAKSPNITIQVKNYSILPKNLEIKFQNIKQGSVLDNGLELKKIEPNQNITLYLKSMSNNVFIIKLPENTPLRFAVVGDSRPEIRSDSYPEIFKIIMKDIDSKNVDFVIHLGDFVLEPFNKDYNEFIEIINDFDTPVYTVIGNHEKGADGDSIYKDYFGVTYYSFDYKDAKLIFLDNSIGLLNQDTYSFLKNELNDYSCQKKFIFMHIPPFDPRPSGISHILDGENFTNLVEAYNVDNVFSGHIHFYYQREIAGTNYIISGGGGSPLHSTPEKGGVHHYIIYENNRTEIINMGG